LPLPADLSASAEEEKATVSAAGLLQEGKARQVELSDKPLVCGDERRQTHESPPTPKRDDISAGSRVAALAFFRTIPQKTLAAVTHERRASK
jgi:hypothetical protein